MFFLQKKYIIALAAFVTLGSVLIFLVILSNKKPSATLESGPLAFYSADFSQSDQQDILSQFKNNLSISDISNNNISVRPKTFSKKYTTIDELPHTDIAFLIDSKKPNVTYQVDYDISKETSILTISCPSLNQQRGNPSECKDLSKL